MARLFKMAGSMGLSIMSDMYRASMLAGVTISGMFSTLAFHVKVKMLLSER